MEKREKVNVKGPRERRGGCNKEKGRDICGITVLIQLMPRATPRSHISHILQRQWQRQRQRHHRANSTHAKAHPLILYLTHMSDLLFSVAFDICDIFLCDQVVLYQTLFLRILLLCIVNDFTRSCGWVVLYHPLVLAWTLHLMLPLGPL